MIVVNLHSPEDCEIWSVVIDLDELHPLQEVERLEMEVQRLASEAATLNPARLHQAVEAASLAHWNHAAAVHPMQARQNPDQRCFDRHSAAPCPMTS